jgi:pyruvate-formate lyase-activating enzyme
MKRDRRLELLVGYTCNNNCKFCYVFDDRKKYKDKTTKELKKDLIEARKRGTKELAFLGGEASIRPDVIELIRFARKQGFKEVKLTTNGRMLSYTKFAKRAIKAGLTKVLFSIHGSNAEIHDNLTQVKGSFNQIIQGVKNVKKYNVIIETNSTITKSNYKDLPNMAELFDKLEMLSSEFIFVFPYGNALHNFDEIVPRYVDATPCMIKAVKIGMKSKTKILMRYLPFCVLPEYELYIAELYDPPEREQIGPNIETLDVINARKTIDRAKLDFCKECKFEILCEGPWRIYPEFRGTNEFKPIPGKKIKTIKELKKLRNNF